MVSSLLGFSLSRRWARMDAHNWWTSIGGWDRLEMGSVGMTTEAWHEAMGKNPRRVERSSGPPGLSRLLPYQEISFGGDVGLLSMSWEMVICHRFFFGSKVLPRWSPIFQNHTKYNFKWNNQPPLEPKRVRVVKQSKKPLPFFCHLVSPNITSKHPKNIPKNPLNNNKIQKIQTKKNSNHPSIHPIKKPSTPKKIRTKKQRKITWLMSFHMQRPSSSGRARPQTAGSQRPRSANVQVLFGWVLRGMVFIGEIMCIYVYIYIYELNKSSWDILGQDHVAIIFVMCICLYYIDLYYIHNTYLLIPLFNVWSCFYDWNKFVSRKQIKAVNLQCFRHTLDQYFWSIEILQDFLHGNRWLMLE